MYLHLNSQIFPINSNADAEGILLRDSNADSVFGKLLNSNSDTDSAKVRMHSIMNVDADSDSPSLSVTIRMIPNVMSLLTEKAWPASVFSGLESPYAPHVQFRLRGHRSL